MHGPMGIILSNKEILIHALYSHKSKALGMSSKYTCQKLSFAFTVFTLLGNFHLSLQHELIQHFLQIRPLFFGNVKKDCQLLDLHGYIKVIIHKITEHLLSLFHLFFCHHLTSLS